MRRVLKCLGCRKEVSDVSELSFLPGQEVYDSHSDLAFNTGGNYCKDCLLELSTPLKLEVSKEPSKQKDSEESKEGIANLYPNETVSLQVKIVSKLGEKFLEKDGNALRLGMFKVKDSTGEITLILWNDDVDSVKEGDVVYIENAYVRSFNNSLQLTLGKKGRVRH